MRWLEYAHLGCPMADGDFVFPAIGANGAVYPGEPISHDKIQKYINEATAGSGIEGNFTTHCFRQGGAQYRFIQARGEEKWDLDVVRWWGGWAEGEHVECQVSFLVFFLLTLLPLHLQNYTLIRYLLDELHYYQHNYSDALWRPRRSDTDMSLIADRALLAPASREELRSFHSSVTADLREIHDTVATLDNSMSTVCTKVGHIKDMLGNVTNSLRGLTEAIIMRSGPLPSTMGIGNYSPAFGTRGMPFEFASLH